MENARVVRCNVRGARIRLIIVRLVKGKVGAPLNVVVGRGICLICLGMVVGIALNVLICAGFVRILWGF